MQTENLSEQQRLKANRTLPLRKGEGIIYYDYTERAKVEFFVNATIVVVLIVGAIFLVPTTGGSSLGVLAFGGVKHELKIFVGLRFCKTL